MFTMYPGAACNRVIPERNAKALHFKENEGGMPFVNPAAMIPGVNISETAVEYLIKMATPGMHRDDFRVEINQAVIVISAKKDTLPENFKKDRCEYDYTEWTRAFELPEDADALLTRAEYANGELIIRIPRGSTDENKEKVTIYVY